MCTTTLSTEGTRTGNLRKSLPTLFQELSARPSLATSVISSKVLATSCAGAT